MRGGQELESYDSVAQTSLWRDAKLIKHWDKFHRQVAIDQSVYFARGLRATEFVCFVCSLKRDEFLRS
jgi:hypothetical protein